MTMRFSDSDIRPNVNMPLASVRIGATSDARWRYCDDDETIDSTVRHATVRSIDQSITRILRRSS